MASEEILPPLDYSEEIDSDNINEQNNEEDLINDKQVQLNPDLTKPKEKSIEKSTETRLTQLPITRIRAIMKLDPDLTIASQEAVFLITKSCELFIESLAREAFVHTVQAKKKTIQKPDVELAISSVDALMFLEGTLNV